MLRDGEIDKYYLALVAGQWRGGARRVELALEKNRQGPGAAVEVGEDGKESVSEFRPREKFDAATLVEVHLLTGRMHQARVHAAHLGHRSPPTTSTARVNSTRP